MLPATLEIILIFILSIGSMNETQAQSKFWITGYYAGWMQGWYNNCRLPAGQIDYSTINYVIHFGLVPQSDGTIDFSTNSILQSNSDSLVSSAHAAGRKVLICIGGWGSDVAFRGATSALNLASFVTTIVQFVVSRGYDGVDIDWEVLEASDRTQYVNFIELLRMTLNNVKPGALITAAVAWQPSIIASVQQYLDQINLMTYDLSGPWNGWVSWYNSPVYSGNYRFPSNGQPLPSIDNMVNQFIAAGVAKNKIGIGIDFYGYIWQGGDGTNTGGVSAPLQSWNDAPEVIPNVPYYSIMDSYYRPDYYRWDSTAEACYLHVDDSCNSNDMFISYDDERACKSAVEYALSKGLGGVFIWELGAGVRSSPSDQPLVSSIKDAAYGISTVPQAPVASSPPQNANQENVPVIISWYPSSQAVAYRIQVSNDSTFTSVVIDSIISTATSDSLINLMPSQKYYWRVNALNQTGSSSFTPPNRFITSGPPLTPPVLLEPKDKAMNSPVNLTFKWQRNSNASSYELQVAASSDFCELMLDTLISNDSSFSYSGLEFNKTYFWHLRAVPKNNLFGISTYSAARTFITTNYPPGIPEIISPSNDMVNVSLNPTLVWRQSAYAYDYELKISTSISFNIALIDSSNITQTSIKLASLKPNTAYYWEVKAYNAAGTSNWSEFAKFTTGSIGKSPLLSGGPPASYELMQNFPNPFNNSTILEFGVPVISNVQLYIFNSLGKLIRTFSFNNLDAGVYDFSFDDFRLASGIYFYTIKAAALKEWSQRNFIQTKKMVLLK